MTTFWIITDRFGGVKNFDSLVKARAYATELIDGKSGIGVSIYDSNPFKAKKLKAIGHVSYSKGMGSYYWNVFDRVDSSTREPYYKSRPIYKNGKMAGRF